MQGSPDKSGSCGRVMGELRGRGAHLRRLAIGIPPAERLGPRARECATETNNAYPTSTAQYAAVIQNIRLNCAVLLQLGLNFI